MIAPKGDEGGEENSAVMMLEITTSSNYFLLEVRGGGRDVKLLSDLATRCDMVVGVALRSVNQIGTSTSTSWYCYWIEENGDAILMHYYQVGYQVGCQVSACLTSIYRLAR